MSTLVLGMGLVAVVLLASALASGVVERVPLSFPIIFLSLGLFLGGTGLLEVELNNVILELVAVVTLSLVLFLDAVNLQVEELRREWRIPALTLGPGILLTVGGVALASSLLLNTTVAQSILLGAILASTDPVVLRDVVRDGRIPRSVRRTLSVEAGMSDIIILPIVIVFIALLNQTLGGLMDWLSFGVRVLILSPLAGLLVGGIGSRLMGEADKRFGISTSYQAMYGIGLVLAAYFAGTAINGDGFLAAYFAGLAVTLFNTSLCQCFLDYGEVTSEMMMLLAFVLFGAVLYGTLGDMALAAVLIPAMVIGFLEIVVIRPAALTAALWGAKMSNAARLFIGWFGPRGLDSLLLALLVVQSGVPDGERLFGITGVVVVMSVFIHGVSATPLAGWYARQIQDAASTLKEERESSFTGLFDANAEDIPRISTQAAYDLMLGGKRPILLDVRARNHYERDAAQIPGSVRTTPDMVREWADALPEADRARPVIAYCDCPAEESAGRVARQLRARGMDAYALTGGYLAWEADSLPLEAKGMVNIIMAG